MTFAPGLLGTHVSRCPRHAATLAEVLVSERKTEVGDTGFTRSVNEDVGGLDIPVDQPSAMGVMQCLGNRGDQLGRIPQRRSSLSHPDRQIAAFDELRDHEAESVFRATHIEDRHDMGMVQFGEDSGFNEKCFHVLRVFDSIQGLAP